MRTRLAEIMDDLGISQSELAKWTGLNQGRISQHRVAKAQFTESEAEKYERFFLTDAKELQRIVNDC